MNNATTAPLNDGAQMGGNDTANTQNTITLNYPMTEYKNLISDLALEGFWGYFKSQPLAMAVLGERIQFTKNIPEREALSSFIEAIKHINHFVYSIMEHRPMLNEIHDILSEIEKNAKFIVTD